MKIKRWSIAIGAILVAVMLVGDLPGQKRSRRRRRSGNRNQQAVRKRQAAARKIYQQQKKVYQDQLRRATAQAQAVQLALNELRRAEKSYKQLKEELEKQYNESAKVASAKRARDRAHEDYKKERQRVWDRLAKDSEFQRLQDEKEWTHEQIAALRDSDSPDQEQIKALAKQELAIARQMSNLKADAVDADSTAAAALASYEDANKRLRELKRQLPEFLAKTPKLNAAMATVQQARNKLARARTSGGRAQGVKQAKKKSGKQQKKKR